MLFICSNLNIDYCSHCLLNLVITLNFQTSSLLTIKKDSDTDVGGRCSAQAEGHSPGNGQSWGVPPQPIKYNIFTTSSLSWKLLKILNFHQNCKDAESSQHFWPMEFWWRCHLFENLWLATKCDMLKGVAASSKHLPHIYLWSLCRSISSHFLFQSQHPSNSLSYSFMLTLFSEHWVVQWVSVLLWWYNFHRSVILWPSALFQETEVWVYEFFTVL